MGIAPGLLAIASGALKGVDSNRQRKREREELDRKRKREDDSDELDRILNMLRLQQTPGVSMGGEEPAAPPAPADPIAGVSSILQRSREIAGATKAPRLGVSEPAAEPAAPDLLALAGRAAGVNAGSPTPTGGPAAAQSATRQRLGSFFGKDIFYDPSQSERAVGERKESQKKAEENQRQRTAYDALKAKDKNAYPRFLEGYDYLGELEKVGDDSRTAARQTEDDTRTATRQREDDERRRNQALADRERERKTNQARTRVANLLQAGTPIQQALTAVNADPQLKGLVSFDDAKAIASEVNSTKNADPKLKERRDGMEKKLGSPTTQLEQDILDDLSDGFSKQEILDAMKGGKQEDLTAATNYLRKLR